MSLAPNLNSKKTQHYQERPQTGRAQVKELFRRLRRDIVWHDCFGKAAELAFYFQLALFPLLIFLLSLIGFVPEAQQIILFWLGRLMPAEATEIVEKWVQEVISRRSRGILSFSLIFSLWSASTGVRTLISALNRAYEVEEGRPLWKSQLLALGLTMALCVLVIGGALIITFGEQLIATIGSFLGLAGSVETIWRVFHYMIGLMMLIVGTAVIYYFWAQCKARLAFNYAWHRFRHHRIHPRFVSVFAIYTLRSELLRGLRELRSIYYFDALAFFDGFYHLPGRRNQFGSQEGFSASRRRKRSKLSSANLFPRLPGLDLRCSI